MTYTEINIAIAEACGWTKSAKGWWSHPTLPDNGGAEPEPPNYCADLNEMYQAEKMLLNDTVETYERELKEVTTSGARVCDFSLYASDRIWNATARQRAEAFLRTIGKWVDSPEPVIA